LTDFTGPQLSVLRILADGRSRSTVELARTVGKSPTAVQKTLTWLYYHGYLERFSVYKLTTTGKSAIAALDETTPPGRQHP
jgi:DNA-binding MarR family transcriptional regulator